MTSTYLHLMLNHVPVLGTSFGSGLLVFGLLRKSHELKKTALGVFILASIMTLPVYLSGEPAEGVAKVLPGVSMQFMETHENAAFITFASVIMLGTVSLIGLITTRRDKMLPIWMSFAMLAFALNVSGLMAWTAGLGGQIRHSEIRSDATGPAAKGNRDRD